MNKFVMALAAAAVLTVSAPAEAKHRHHRIAPAGYGGQVVAHPPGCPWRLFCGCGVSWKVFGRAVVSGGLAIAAEWSRFQQTTPAPGMVAYRKGHVFEIESVIDRETVVAYDPNSGGHLTRIHTVSLRGYHVVDPHSQRLAMR